MLRVGWMVTAHLGRVREQERVSTCFRTIRVLPSSSHTAQSTPFTRMCASRLRTRTYIRSPSHLRRHQPSCHPSSRKASADHLHRDAAPGPARRPAWNGRRPIASSVNAVPGAGHRPIASKLYPSRIPTTPSERGIGACARGQSARHVSIRCLTRRVFGTVYVLRFLLARTAVEVWLGVCGEWRTKSRSRGGLIGPNCGGWRYR